jgi:5-methyltetrahydrofolate--homocysteine methyltransferase
LSAILQRLEREILVRSGATGTMVKEKGAELGGCIGQWIVDHPEPYQKLLEDYFQAGCHICGGGTSGLNRFRLEKFGLQEKVRELNRQVMRLALAMKPAGLFISGLIGPTGKFLEPAGDLSFEQALQVFSEHAEALAEGGADMIAVDTFYGLEEAVAALRAVKSTTRLPVLVSFAFQPDPKGFHTMMGLSPEAAAIRLEQEGADIVGANCGGVTPEQMTSVVELMRRNCTKPICAKPNAGSPEMVAGKEVYRASPEQLAEKVPDWIKAGARMVSACCGSTPEHLRKMSDRVKMLQ